MFSVDPGNHDVVVEKFPKPNETFVSEKTHKKYRLLSILGSGGYGTVFEATDETRKVAIKMEKLSKSMLQIEANVLKIANQHHCTRILEYIEYPHFAYLIMPLLGKDLCTLRNEQKSRCFTRSSVVRVGILSFLAIQELHGIGFISRDIKPGNFAIGLGPNSRRIFLFDFGLARKYMDHNKNIIPPRKDIGWRGTTRYGSLQAHIRQDLSRKDDCESCFYMLVEVTRGALPWRMMTDRSMVHTAKVSARAQNRSTFLEKCPSEYDEILTHIDSLAFSDAPNYEKITGLLELNMKQGNITWDQRYDWEDETQKTVLQPSSGVETKAYADKLTE